MLRLFRAFNIDGKINLWAHCRDENTSRCKSYSRGWNPASVGLDLDHHFPTIHRVWTHFNYPNLCMTSASHHSSPDSMLCCDNKLEFFQAPRSRLWVMPQLARLTFSMKSWYLPRCFHKLDNFEISQAIALHSPLKNDSKSLNDTFLQPLVDFGQPLVEAKVESLRLRYPSETIQPGGWCEILGARAQWANWVQGVVFCLAK